MQIWRPEKAKIVHGTQVVNVLLDIFSSANNTISVCGNSKFPSQLLLLDITRKAIAASNNRIINQRYLVEVVKDNIQSCRNLMEIAAQNNSNFRHSDDIEANFIVNEKEYLGSITLKEPNQQAIHSNMKDMVKQQHYIFESLWNRAIPIQDKIIEIEQGREPEFYEVINDYEKAQEKYIELARSIEREALLLFANSKAMLRAHKLGVLDYLIEASSKKGAIVRIVCPLSEENSEIVKTISERGPDIRILHNDNASSHSGLFVADRAKLMRFELKEPKAEEFSEAIGFVILSNNRASVESSKSFFELLWNERMQQEKLKEYEKLKEADRIKTEFINVAAHELRTPIQPIIGLGEVLRSNNKLTSQEYNEFLDAIIRNAKRLQQLADDILDVTLIESHSLKIKYERFDFHELVIDIVNNYSQIIAKSSKNVKLEYRFNEGQGNTNSLFIYADKVRISQVLSNLLANAIKFTEEGNIVLAAKINDGNRDSIIVSVKDNGLGIDTEILPHLFTKFASKSFQGTGLGLFISKSIIEAHGGKIWAENNSDGKGATFYFTMPLQKIQVRQ
ncbi:MAG TPA: HAMP domain-containing sensor histidine kinase [Nitrososphaeraceae archaeon]|nr:HAMP domain-containing sensor histidine kinase [Nitrososphaeraceae archaeon]